MFKHILVPVDLTGAHERALQIAADLASQAGGQVTLLHVIETIEGLSVDEEKEFYGKLEGRALDYLKTLGGRLDPARARWNAELLYGERAREILRFARDKQIDLIVLSSHKLDPQQPAARWGTLSHKVSILSQCPVMLVK